MIKITALSNIFPLRKILFSLLFLLHFTNIIHAQEQATINLSLRNYVIENSTSNELLQLLVQGNETIIQNAVKNLGGNFKYSINQISAVTLPVNKIFILSQTSGIKRIEGRHGIGHTLDDQTDIHANITPVKQGQSPLPQAYDGTGVIIGIIDTEIDIYHPDFIDASGNTRIKYLWSQIDTSGGSTPMPFNYGQEWDAASINAGCLYVPTTSALSHGSVVTGAACGDPDNTLYQGVAPKSDIIFVAADLGPNFLNNTVDAVNYIYTKAVFLGKPCVINASVGTYNGSHDGLDLPALSISNLIVADSSRSFVAAAGNAGNRLLHLQYPVETDSAFTWFKVNPSTQNVIYELWAYKSQFDNVQFAIGADLNSPYTYLGRTNYYNILTDFIFSGGFAQLNDTLKTWAGTPIADFSIQAETIDTTYHLLITINTNNASNFSRLITKGVGQFDIWSQPTYTGTSDMIKTVSLPPVSSYPDVARYRSPNQTQTIVSSFQCSEIVITVANFNNRNTWTEVTGSTYSTTDTVGERGFTSSIGPTRDGRMKPDISASGNNTFGALMLSMQATFIGGASSWKVSADSLHLIDGGTSMAAPVVAGVIGLYMQRYPSLDWKEIKDALLASAYTDSFTTTLVPNIKWGYGKVDAFNFLQTLLVYGCTDSTALNYNPLATINDSSCIVDGIAELKSTIDFTIYPNPTANEFNIFYSHTTAEQIITIVNIYGQEIFSKKLISDSENNHEIKNQNKVDFKNYPSGIYYCILKDGKTILAVSKLVKL